MEAACSSNTSPATYKTARCQNLEENYLNDLNYENTESLKRRKYTRKQNLLTFSF